MRALVLAAVLFLCAVSAGWGGVGHKKPKPPPRTGQSSVPAKTHWRATRAKLPANAAAGEYQTVAVNSVSCALPGNCIAVGSYYDIAGNQEGLLLAKKKGRWARGVEAVLPANAASNPQVNLWSVSCASAGDCTAVGVYSAAGTSDLLLTETNGHWATGVEAPVPAGASASGLVSVSCPSAENCAAVDGVAGFLVTETEGDWVAVPAGITDQNLDSVSCPSAGNCTAVGGSPEDGGEGLLLTETAGHWAPGVTYYYQDISELTSVSCAPDGSCSAVGYFYYPGDNRSSPEFAGDVLLTKKHGKWRQINADALSSPGEGADLASVSCVSGGNCSATGLSGVGIDSSTGAGLGLLLSEHAGKWLRGTTAKPPRNAGSGYWRKYLDPLGISCASPVYCVATGQYHASGNLHWALVTKEAGKWRRAVEAPLPSDANGPDAAFLSALSCGSPGSCTVVGTYYGDSSHHANAGQHVLLLDGTTKVRKRGTR